MLLLATASLILPGQAAAWKPITHSFTGQQAWADATDGDHQVTIAGNPYTLDARVENALKDWPAYYNSGVVGPDGFPDIAYGQSIIHPEHTGLWLKYILDQAWSAQSTSSCGAAHPTDPCYSDTEKSQILAFSYGFLTHAAGDMWGHTLINDFAGGVFPAIADIPGSLRNAKIALRHLVSEGYVGDATPGVDSANSDDQLQTGASCNAAVVDPPDTICNPGTASEDTIEPSQVCAAGQGPPTRATTCTVDGPGGSTRADVSADSTPGIDYAIPQRFIQNAMISLDARTPADNCPQADSPGCPGGPFDDTNNQLNRGPVLNFFLNREADLQVEKAKLDADIAHTDCGESISGCVREVLTVSPIHTVRGIKRDAQIITRHCNPRTLCSTLGPLADDPGDGAGDTVYSAFISPYLGAWIDDIDQGIAHWSEFSLGVVNGLFNPQTARDAANDACAARGSETVLNVTRNTCEQDNGGALDAVLFALNHTYDDGPHSWINRYLIPMSGLPDIVGNANDFLQSVGDAFDEVITQLGIVNPIAAIKDNVNKFVHDTINGFIKDQYDVDVEALSQFEHTPSQWMCGSDANNPLSVTLPGVGTLSPGGIFNPHDHERLDSLMGLGAQSDHHEQHGGLPLECSPLSTDARWTADQFPAIKNTILTAKLLLLDGKQLNALLHDNLAAQGVLKSAAQIKTYSQSTPGTPANVLVDGLDSGVATRGLTWLELIDGDHAWRQDGLPRFCNPTATPEDPITCAALPAALNAYDPAPRSREGDHTGGNGHFPMWESCVLRPVFQGVDSQGQPAGLFTDWENAGNTPGQRNFPAFGDDPSPDASAPDAPHSTLTSTATTYSTATTTYVGGDNQFRLDASSDVFTDGQIAAQYRANGPGSPAGTFVDLSPGASFSLPAGASDGTWQIDYRAQDPCHTFTESDALPTPTRNRQFVLDTTPPQITISSPPAGSVFASDQISALAYGADDGAGSGLASTRATLDGASASNGQSIDAFTLAPGVHTITVSATDHVGNRATQTRTFEIHATAASLLNNIDRACREGLISKKGSCNSLSAKLSAAQRAHERGQHSTEWNILGAFINELSAQSGKSIDQPVAARLTAFARDLIAQRG